MVQATGQRILRKKEVKINNFFTLGSGIFVTLDYGILLDFEEAEYLSILHIIKIFLTTFLYMILKYVLNRNLP